MVTGVSANELRQRFAAQRKAFRKHAPDYADRRHALGALLSGLLRFESDFVTALNADFGNRARQETQILEIFPVVDEIRHIKRHLRAWMRPRSVFANWQSWPSRARIHYQPLGVIGILGAWNYPILLALSPLANALAAGNHAMIKPSEMAPATAEVVSHMIAETFPPDYVTVVTGGPETGALFCALAFDHIIFTGSTRVGKLVMRAAAENLTPVTLELGGKSPALVHADFPVEVAADRICSAKIWNAGQTCVAPDYVLVPAAAEEAFLAEAKNAIVRRLPRLLDNADYTHIIDRSSWERLAALVKDAREAGAEVVHLNPAGEDWTAETLVFAPTLVANVNDSMRVMQEEIFGPVLPVVTYSSLEEAIAYVNGRPCPLAFYYFDYDSARVRRVLESTTSGGSAVNDCMIHFAQNNLPFGGVGASGMGAYHGAAGFKAFSHEKGVFLQSRLSAWLVGRFLKPPYTRWSDLFIRSLIRRPSKRRRRTSRRV
jgi:coniferyl-aldehyde dehydrogenase